MRATILATILAFGTQAGAHSGGLDKQGCHAGSKPYHCHKAQNLFFMLLLQERSVLFGYLGQEIQQRF